MADGQSFEKPTYRIFSAFLKLRCLPEHAVDSRDRNESVPPSSGAYSGDLAGRSCRGRIWNVSCMIAILVTSEPRFCHLLPMQGCFVTLRWTSMSRFRSSYAYEPKEMSTAAQVLRKLVGRAGHIHDWAAVLQHASEFTAGIASLVPLVTPSRGIPKHSSNRWQSLSSRLRSRFSWRPQYHYCRSSIQLPERDENCFEILLEKSKSARLACAPTLFINRVTTPLAWQPSSSSMDKHLDMASISKLQNVSISRFCFRQRNLARLRKRFCCSQISVRERVCVNSMHYGTTNYSSKDELLF